VSAATPASRHHHPGLQFTPQKALQRVLCLAGYRRVDRDPTEIQLLRREFVDPSADECRDTPFREHADPLHRHHPADRDLLPLDRPAFINGCDQEGAGVVEAGGNPRAELCDGKSHQRLFFQISFTL
jgi:hypothetical protein